MPQVVADPAFIEPNVSPPETGTGTGELSIESFPRIPSSPLPQQKASPSVVIPQVCANPELTDSKDKSPDTAVGIMLFSEEPFPSLPYLPRPQQ
jgi:hypothetical protein